HRPRRASLCVTRRETRGECRTSEFHFITIPQNAIDFRWLVETSRLVRIIKVTLTTRLDYIDIAFHHHVLRAGKSFDRRTPATVVRVCMTNQKNLDVAELESQRLHARADHRYIRFEIAVDENVSLGRRDEIARQSLAAHVVKISCNLECGKRFEPVVLHRRLRLPIAGDNDNYQR